MQYKFDETLFKNTFKVMEDKPVNLRRLIHVTEMGFKLFPNLTNKDQKKVPPVKDMEDVIGGVFRCAMNVEKKQIRYDDLLENFINTVDVSDDHKDIIGNAILGLLFKNGKFCPTNIKLYPYKTPKNSREVDADELAYFLYCVLGNSNDIQKIVTEHSNKECNVLEKIIIDYVESIQNTSPKFEEPYIPIYTGMQDIFLNDLEYMLSSDMDSEEDLGNLLALYYFQYYVQSSLVLDQFCKGKPENNVPLYFALDWERVSKNRKCCIDGWDKVKINVEHGFAHKTTLGILSNNSDHAKLTYCDFGRMASESQDADEQISNEIRRAESIYTSYLGDFQGFENIPESPSINKTDASLKHLFNCAEEQFKGTSRKDARKSFNDKFILFCKDRWIKDRKKSGLVLNLTESDIIFLTKLAIGESEKLRLNDLFKEYERRGVYLDTTSKTLLQDYFAKLNIIDKKSDSGDSQYVRRIL